MPEVERRHNRVLHLKVGRVSHGVRHQTVVSALRPVTARNPKPNPFVLGLNGRGKKLELVRVEKLHHQKLEYNKNTSSSGSSSGTTLGLSWCLRVLGVGGFKTVPGTVLMVAGTWLVLEDLSLVQFELYRGGVQNLHPP